MKALLITALVILASVSASQAIIVEAESYIASYNAGGLDIYVVNCTSASGGLAVDGVDTTGDWIEVVLDVPEIYGYADSLRSAGYLNYESDIRATVFGGDPDGGDVVSYYHTIGQGIG